MSSLAQWSPQARAVLRIVVALLFLEHATMKFAAFPASMPGMEHGLPPLIIAAGVIELCTGVLVTLGLFTRIFALLASGEMAIGYWMIHAPQGPWPALNQGEPAILYCFVFLYLVFAGPGAWALDNVIGKRAVAPQA
ncbi:MAG: DoxX family protein [Porphyrobacter sp.]|nr:DoxX family protein [Porphyrobacter sp.]